jgi:ectoine hydroxylase-related dioxygenase (phytanoyl-CoA dioxygenase family)
LSASIFLHDAFPIMTDRPVLHKADLHALDEQGFVVIRKVMDRDWLQATLDTCEQLLKAEGASAGSEFRQEPGSDRLANLVDKGECFRRLVSHPLMLEAAESVLGPDWKLSSLNYRAALPGEGLQPLHCDMGLAADASGYAVFNSIWLLDDFTTENGPTRFIPGTHRSGQLPQQALSDPLATHPGQQIALGKAGDVILTNAHMWHGGTTNRSARARRSLHGFYVRGDKPQQQYQKRLLRPQTQALLSPLMRRILALDDPRNDLLSESGSGRSGFLR